jgi:hypothetical protein
MKHISYLIYSTVWYSISLLPFVYVVFWKDANPWWIALGAFLAMTIASPQSWGITRDKECNCQQNCCKQNNKTLILE